MLELNLIETEDQSLTARLGDSEAMHSLKGAFSETMAIYGRALLLAHQVCQPLKVKPRVCSMGLGLGYVEILSACYALKFASPLKGVSFESVPELTASFRNWVLGESNSVLVPAHVYDAILDRHARAFEIAPARIRAQLASAIESGEWTLKGGFDATELSPEAAYHCVAYDAFSSKTSPDLWTEDFLFDFFRLNCATPCVVSTYACTGALKRALANAGFTVEIKPGFASKRDSTFAFRVSQELK